MKHLCRLALILSCVAGCARGSIIEDEGADSGIMRDVAADSADDAATEVGEDTDVTADVVLEDTPADAVEDVVEDTNPDTQTDTVPDVVPDTATDTTPDTTTDVDTGPGCIGPGCACTIQNATAVCDGLACIDGFCCNEACSGACRACNVAGSEGTCTLHADTTDPDNECALQSEASCGLTGYCDGGACEFYGTDTACNDSQACSESDMCDGSGGCLGTIPSDCGPGVGNQCCVGTCSDAGGCESIAGSCPDVCGSSEITIGATCNGCGGAGAVGLCGGGGSHRCDADNHNQCQELSCGGITYWCSETGGDWAWRPASTCDDGDLCTHTDRCNAGSCGGTGVTCDSDSCIDRACNGSATCDEDIQQGKACDDGDLCTYDDACSAAGACVGGSTTTCTDTDCIDRSCVGDGTCTELIRTGSTCNDGNLCTYDDTCTAAGMCGGSALVCTGMDTTCLGYDCDGTASCAAVPQNVGGVCDDGNAETDPDTCTAAGICEGDVGCPPPTLACTTGTQSRDGCSNARIVGRTDAAGGGIRFVDNLCSARDRFDLPSNSDCWDANNDHAYRIYMREGETVNIRLETGEPCSWDETYWNGTLKIIENAGCDSTSCDAGNDSNGYQNLAYCDYNERDQQTNYVAARDGWVIVIAEGSSAFDDEGDYELTFNLTCRHPGCECP